MMLLEIKITEFKHWVTNFKALLLLFALYIFLNIISQCMFDCM